MIRNIPPVAAGVKSKACWVRFKTLFLGILAFAYVSVTGAQTVGTGGVESPFELGGSAWALGMGGSVAAVSGYGDGFFENPAALATVREHEILTFHAPLFLDTLYDSIGYIHPVGPNNSFGLAVTRLGISNILQTTTNIQAISSFSSEEYEALLGYGFRLWDGLDFGGTAKYVYEELSTYQGSGGGLDLGLLYHFSRTHSEFNQFGFRNITMGFSVSNVLRPQIKLFELEDNPVRIYRPAFAYYYQFPGSQSDIWLTAEGEIPDSGEKLVKAGLQYGWNKTFFVRAGFDGTGPTAGAGLRYSDFEFDYAYDQQDLGALSQFSLTYRFGRYVDPFEAQKIDLLKWVAQSYTKDNDFDPAIKAWQNVLREFPDDKEAPQAIKDLQQQRKNLVKDQLQMAQSAMTRGDYQKALPLIAKVLSLDPDNPEAKALLRQIDKKTVVSTNYTRGVEAYSREDYATAIEDLEMVYEVDPHYRDVNYLYHDAQSHYLPLESMSKELTELYAQGVNDYMGGDYRKAIEIWEQVLDKSPKNFLVRRNIEEAKKRLSDNAVPESSSTQSQEPVNKP
jgi:tetratricopeptide (TPR) repeat protein